MDDIKIFLCSSEENRVKIQDAINKYSRSELYKLLLASNATSIVSQVNRNFCSNYFDGTGLVYLFDELDPKQITDYLMENKEYQEDYNIVFALVCRTLMKKINSMYKEFKEYEVNDVFIYHMSLVQIGEVDKSICEKKYKKLVEKRISSPMIRFKSF